MLNTSHACQVLRSLRPQTAVSTPTGTGLVLAQVRHNVTVLESGTVRVLERYQVSPLEYSDDDLSWFRRPVREVTGDELRALGRSAFRGGATMEDAIGFAADAIGRDLDRVKRIILLDGWATERAEVSDAQ